MINSNHVILSDSEGSRFSPRLLALGAMRYALCALLFMLGCGSGTPPSGEIEYTREIGSVRFPGIIRGRDGGYSAKFGGKSVWVFGDTTLESPAADGATWRSSTSCRSSDKNPDE